MLRCNVQMVHAAERYNMLDRNWPHAHIAHIYQKRMETETYEKPHQANAPRPTAVIMQTILAVGFCM